MTTLVAQGFDDEVLRHFSDETLRSETSSIYGLWPDLTFGYFNEGWLAFARENDGPDEEATRAYLDRSLFDVIAPELRAHFEEFFRTARKISEKDLHPPRMHYDCNSPTRFRSMVMTAFAAPYDVGFLVVHSPVREASLESRYDLKSPDDVREYLDDNGLIHQCAHCRRVMHPSETGRWDMVPDLIRHVDLRVSHTLCMFCRDIFWNV